MPGVVDRAACSSPAVGASSQIRDRLRIVPTIRVDSTKSSSFRPKLGRVDMSPATEALTPMTCSISTLRGNRGSAATRSRQPLSRKNSSLSSPEPPWPSPPLPPLPPLPPPAGCHRPVRRVSENRTRPEVSAGKGRTDAARSTPRATGGLGNNLLAAPAE